MFYKYNKDKISRLTILKINNSRKILKKNIEKWKTKQRIIGIMIFNIS